MRVGLKSPMWFLFIEFVADPSMFPPRQLEGIASISLVLYVYRSFSGPSYVLPIVTAVYLLR